MQEILYSIFDSWELLRIKEGKNLGYLSDLVFSCSKERDLTFTEKRDSRFSGCCTSVFRLPELDSGSVFKLKNANPAERERKNGFQISFF